MWLRAVLLGLGLLLGLLWLWRRPVRVPRGAAVRTWAVLGSGGHTREMLALVRTLPAARYGSVRFLAAETDHTSEPKLRATPDVAARADPRGVLLVPRAREVGQAYGSAVWTTLRAWAFCVRAAAREPPELLLVNGPGTCVPVVLACLLLRALGRARTRVVYVESFARTRRLSLSGRLLYRLVDRFMVQWPELAERYRGAECVGVVV